jgi:tetratricopeptide (TPR) repeat protein
MRSTNAFFLICIFLCATPLTDVAFAAKEKGGTFSVADSLFRAADYFYAALEYERVYYTAESQQVRIGANMCKAQALKQTGAYGKAMNDLRRSLPYLTDPNERYLVLYEFAFCAYMSGNYDEALSTLQQIAFFYEDADVLEDVHMLTSMVLIQTDQWDALDKQFASWSESFAGDDVQPLIAGFINLLEQERRPVVRNTNRARMLSTFLPGAGHVYAGESGKGLLNASSQLASLGVAALLAWNGLYISTFTLGLSLFQSFYFGGIKQAGGLTDARNQRELQGYKRQLSDALFDIWSVNKSSNHLVTAKQVSLSEPVKAASGGKNPSTLQSNMEQLQLALYAFNFVRADSICMMMEREYPTHYLSQFARSNYLWWQIITSPENVSLENMFRERIARAVSFSVSGQMDTSSDQDIFYFISMYAMRARLDFTKGAFIRAMKNGRNAISWVDVSLGNEYNFEGYYLTSGLYNYMVVQSGIKYPFLKIYSLFYPEGNKTLGLEQLRKASLSSNRTLQTEAHYFLMRIFLDMEGDVAQALAHANWLTVSYPENLIYQYYLLVALETLGDKQAALEKRQEIRSMAHQNKWINDSQRKYFVDLVTEK